MTTRTTFLLVGLLALGLAAPVAAQGDPSTNAGTPDSKAARPAAEATRPPAPGESSSPKDFRVATATLRVQLVISRFQDDKKVASLPYSFLVGARTPGVGGVNRVRMRMGVDTPVTVSSAAADGNRKTETQYRNVGTNIDCWATDQGNGTYQLNLSVENSSALTGAGSRDNLSGAPLFRRFETFIDPVLRDGQTIQTVASTDPVTGEVVKIDVTVNVVK